MQRFLDGFRNFKNTYHDGEDSLFSSLKKGQHPRVMVVSCCDSRVDPALMLGCHPGDIFVVRNIAALVPENGRAACGDSTIAALSYGVLHLKVTDLIVLGHSHCGGIAALTQESCTSFPGYLSGWLSHAKPVLELAEQRFPELAGDELHAMREHLSVLLSTDALLTYPWIRERVEAGKLRLHPWFFDLEAGDLLCYSREHEAFERLSHLSPQLFDGADDVHRSLRSTSLNSRTALSRDLPVSDFYALCFRLLWNGGHRFCRPAVHRKGVGLRYPFLMLPEKRLSTRPS